mmetsp:Transcript_6649/g.15929  ORF Transcript_6649/g.15929 Transcript_6649/m.15929 type:complete len:137 (+) Transcript_6649:62-472(+)
MFRCLFPSGKRLHVKSDNDATLCDPSSRRQDDKARRNSRSLHGCVQSAPIKFVPPSRPEGVQDAPDNDEECVCSVCMEGYCAGQEMRTLPCCHRFHRSCVDQWLQLSDTCPTCTTDAQARDVRVTWVWTETTDHSC